MNKKTQSPEASVVDYIVRVYRFAGKRRGGVVGIVETVGNEVKTAFTNVDELWNILNLTNHGKEGESV